MRFLIASLLLAALLPAAEEPPPMPWWQRCKIETVHPGQERGVDTVRRLLSAVRRFDDRAQLARRLGRPESASVDVWIWTVGGETGAPEPGADILALHFDHGMPDRYELIHPSNARIVLAVPIP